MMNENITGNNKDDLYFIKLTIDLAFKFVFGEPKNTELLKSLLKDITKLPIEQLSDLGFMGEELHRDSLTDRKTIVDVRAILKDKTQIEVEMQVQNHHDMDKRSLYTWSKMYSAQLKKKGKYHQLAKCICINIVNFDFTKETEGHSKYVVKNDKTNERRMNDFEVYFVELPKREQVGDTRLQKWMALLSSQTWDEMKRNAEGDDIMRQVYNQVREIAMNETKRIEVENRELFLIGQNTIAKYEREQGIAEGKIEGIAEGILKANLATARRLLDMGISIEQVMKATELSENEIQTDLKKNNSNQF
jgi:predicted transposase/invertase (TIGR01784 family)